MDKNERPYEREAILERIKEFLKGNIGLFTVLFMSTLFMLLYMSGMMENVENIVVDEVALMTSEDKSPGNNIVYAHTSQRGLKEAEAVYNMGWPWRRSFYNRLIDFLNKAGARLIVFDSMFSEASVYSYIGEKDDKVFADGVSEAQNIIIGMVFYAKKEEVEERIEKKIETLKEKPLSELKELIKKQLKVFKKLKLLKSQTELNNLDEEGVYELLDRYFNATLLSKYKRQQLPFLKKYAISVKEGEDESDKIIEYYRTVAPIKELREKTLQVSGVEGPLDSDGKARRTPLLIRYWGDYYPSLSFATVYHYLKPKNVVINDGEIILDDKKIPLDNNGNMRLKFYGTRHIYPTFYHIDMLRVYDHIKELCTYYKEELKKDDISEEDIYKDYTLLDKLRKEVLPSNPDLVKKVPDRVINKVNTKSFRDKIVLIGSIAPGMFDQRATPFDQKETGVHVHATAIDNILNDDILREYRGEWGLGVMIFVLPLLLYVVVNRLSMGYGILVLLGFIFSIVFIGFMLYTQLNILIDFGTITMSLLLTFPVTSILKYFKESKQKKHIKGIFGQYLSPAVIDIIIEDPDKLQLGGVNREITSFFSDIEKFTTISEKLTPTELVGLLNSYLTEMCDIIIKYDGVVDKFEGDAIIAFWGAPLEQEDHARRAISAVLDIQDRMKELVWLWSEYNLTDLRMRIGINSGNAVVGNMGSRQRMDYTMIGDTVNLAARLEGVNKFYGTYAMISGTTYEFVKDLVEVREVDKVRVVGRSTPVILYEILGRKGAIEGLMRQLQLNHAEGYDYYRRMEFEKAKEVFGRSLELFGDDMLSKVYYERCRQFLEKSPGEGWDGVTNLDKK